MNLNNDKDAFEELITAASVELKIPANIIEKDYYVTLAQKGCGCFYGLPGLSDYQPGGNPQPEELQLLSRCISFHLCTNIGTQIRACD